MEFLIELLRDERQKRIEVENELTILRTILEPMQRKELEQFQLSRMKDKTPLVNSAISSQGLVFNKKLSSNDKKSKNRLGQIDCDCDCTNECSYDEVD